MADVFEEVEEQLRSARYRSLVKKGWPYAAAVVATAFLAFAGYWGFTHYRDTQSAKAAEAYAAAAELGSKGDLAGAEKGLAEIAKSGPGVYKSLALMQISGLRAEEGKIAEAAALMDQAAEAVKEPLVKDAARLKAAYLLFDTLPIAELKARLDPLTEAGRPYSALAREALAMKQMASGQLTEARASFSVLSLMPDATEELRSRAQASIALIDSGSAKNIPAIIAAAKALPPPPVPTPAAVGSAAAPPQGAAAPAQSSTAGAAQ